jgi:hypothetical protein
MPAQGIIANLSITTDRENKIFQYKTKFAQYLSINSDLERIIDGKKPTEGVKVTTRKSKKEIFQQTQRRQPHKHDSTSNNKNYRK